MIRVLVKPEKGPEHPWSCDRAVVHVGRSPRCDLVLNDVAVSRRHARIERRGDGYAICDLQSSNGVIVNGVAVGECALRENDLILLGHTEIRWMTGALPSAEGPAAAPGKPESQAETLVDSWHISIGGGALTVLSHAEVCQKIRAGLIPPSSIAWRRGMAGGAPISQIEDFRPLYLAMETPLPRPVSAPAVRSVPPVPPAPTPPPAPPAASAPAGLQEAVVALAMAHIREGRYRGVSGFLQEVLAKDPTASQAKDLLALANSCLAAQDNIQKAQGLWSQGRHREAIALLKQTRVPDAAPELAVELAVRLAEYERSVPDSGPAGEEAVCPRCGSRNRLPPVLRPDGQYQCGRCKTSLPIPAAGGAMGVRPGKWTAPLPSGPVQPAAPAKCRYCGQALSSGDAACPVCGHTASRLDVQGEEFRADLKARRELQMLFSQTNASEKAGLGEKKTQKARIGFLRRRRGKTSDEKTD